MINFTRKGLYLACLQASLMAMPALAQDNDVIEEVYVEGIRASLEKALSQKRDAVGVMESITAEDMGKTPDQNLAEALSRVAGISIGRDQGEGSSVAVRAKDSV